MRFPRTLSSDARPSRGAAALALTALFALPALGCEGPAEGLVIEKLPEVQPDIPSVPTLPPPPHPIQYPDDSYSIFGVRKKQRVTMDAEVEVTGYIVDIYEPPPCPRGRSCTAKAPHMWIADTKDASERADQLQVVGYAENQEQLEEAIRDAERGRYEPPDPESGLLPIPTDFAVGNKVKVKGRFARVAGSGFNSSMGLLDYLGHETLEPPPEE